MTDKKRTVFVTEAAREAVRRGKEHAYSPSDNVESKPASPSESARELFDFIRPYRPIGLPDYKIPDPPSADECIARIESSWARVREKQEAEIKALRILLTDMHDWLGMECEWATPEQAECLLKNTLDMFYKRISAIIAQQKKESHVEAEPDKPEGWPSWKAKAEEMERNWHGATETHIQERKRAEATEAAWKAAVEQIKVEQELRDKAEADAKAMRDELTRVKRECADRAEAWYKDDRNENIGSLRSAIMGEEHE